MPGCTPMRARRATIATIPHVDAIPDELKRQDILYHLLGLHVGRIAGRGIPVIEGLPKSTSRDNLKALSAAVASSGGVDLWHGPG